jgi:RNA-directed DNA polymerase
MIVDDFNVLKSIEKRVKFSEKEEPNYRTFTIKDKNPLAGTTKTRLISAPNLPMLRINRMFYGFIRLRLKRNNIKFPYATAILQGTNPLKNVLRHLRANNRYFYLLDIKDFYLGITGDQIVSCLTDKTFNLDLAPVYELNEFLKKYCLSPSGVLRMGGPASPDLANLVVARLLDEEMAILCKKYNLVYTRYLDDLTFSSKRRFGKEKRKVIRKTIEKSGFEINHRKTVIADTKKQPVTITGIGIRNGKIFIKRAFLRRMNGLMHLTNKGQFKDQGKKPINVVRGLMSAFWSTIPYRGRSLNELEKKTIRNYLNFSAKYSKKRPMLDRRLRNIIQ